MGSPPDFHAQAAQPDMVERFEEHGRYLHGCQRMRPSSFNQRERLTAVLLHDPSVGGPAVSPPNIVGSMSISSP